MLQKSGNKKRKTAIGLYIAGVIWVVLLNVIAWNSTTFCDAYIAYIFPIWVNTYGRVTGLFSFSVGEWLLVAGVVLVAVAVVLGVLAVVLKIIRVCKCNFTGNAKLKKIIMAYYCFFAWTLLIVCVIMTLNCSILYSSR